MHPLPFQFDLANTGVLVPMILEVFAGDFEARPTFLHPFRRPPAVPRNEMPDIPNPLALGNDAGFSQHPAGQRGDGRTPLRAWKPSVRDFIKKEFLGS